MGQIMPLPASVQAVVDEYIDREHRDAGKFENKEPLDASGAFDLHALASLIYREGWDAGRAYETGRLQRAHVRRLEAKG